MVPEAAPSKEPSAAPPEGRSAWVVPVVLVLVTVVFYWRYQFRSFGFYRDAGIYLSGALGLAAGEGYRLVPFSGQPVIGVYPPLQSLLLSPFVRLGGASLPEMVPWVNGGMILLAVAAVLAGWRVMVRLGSPAWLAGLLALNLALAMRWFEWTFWLMSDIGFTALLLLLAGRVLARPDDRGDRWLWLVVGLGLATAYLWRVAAFGALAATALLAVWAGWRRGNWTPVLAFCGPCLLAGLGWWLLSRQAIGYGNIYPVIIQQAGGGLAGYSRLVLGQFGELLSGRALWEAMIVPLSRLPIALGRASPAAAWLVSAAGFVLAAGVAVTAVLGLRRARRERELALAFVALAYLAFVMVIPNGADHVHRYLFPVLPLLLGLSVRWLGGVLPARWRRPAAIAVTVALLGTAAANAAMTVRASNFASRQYALDELKEVADWTRAHTPPEALVAVDYTLPFVHFHLWSGRKLVTDTDHPGVAGSHIRTDLMGEARAAPYTLMSDQGFAPYRPAGGFEEVKVSRNGHFRLLRRLEGGAR
ncbi:MAG: hypothetical protein ACKVYV_07895 [Limisphaerales bacterium]